MRVSLAGVDLRCPLVAASGTCGYVEELAEVLDPCWLGAITTKSITREPREGNPAWRVVGLPVGMLNAVGLANVGLKGFLAEKLPAASRVDTVLIASIAGHSIEDYVAVAAAFDDRDEIPLVELNVSCPNTDTGRDFGATATGLGHLLAEVRPVLRRTRLIVKLSPDAEEDITSLAVAAIEGGAEALTLINTIRAMAIDVRTRRPRLSRAIAGLSGPAIHPLAVRCVHEAWQGACRSGGIPIIGLGGVMGWEDAAELILAGATVVGLGTALFADPTVPRSVGHGLQRWVDRQGASSVAELVGAMDET